MAKLVFGMNQSLDGYVDHTKFAPRPVLFRHFIEEAESQTGSLYGRRMYQIMRYWDDDHPDWEPEGAAFAAAWRRQPKWVVSRSLKSVGPNASLVEGELETAIRKLKAEHEGEIEVAGPDVATCLTDLGLIDEYRIYLHPVVLGGGTPYFGGPRPHSVSCLVKESARMWSGYATFPPDVARRATTAAAVTPADERTVFDSRNRPATFYVRKVPSTCR